MAEGIQRPDGEGNLRVELLTGSVKGKARQVLLDDVKAGKVLMRHLSSFYVVCCVSGLIVSACMRAAR